MRIDTGSLRETPSDACPPLGGRDTAIDPREAGSRVLAIVGQLADSASDQWAATTTLGQKINRLDDADHELRADLTGLIAGLQGQVRWLVEMVNRQREEIAALEQRVSWQGRVIATFTASSGWPK